MESGRMDAGGVRNEIQGGLYLHAVVQGRDVTLNLPRKIRPALLGLPAKSPAFAGRDSEFLALLNNLSPNARKTGSAVTNHVLVGMGGVGKTELVLQVAHVAKAETGWFPGGVLFIDLSGYDHERYLSADRALTSLLLSLGVSEEQVPVDLQDRSRLYRSILSAYAAEGSRILVVIDNVSSEAQVRPLLPSDGSSVGIVTSRNLLEVGARVHQIAPLDAIPAVDIIRSVLEVSSGGADKRVDSDLASAYDLTRICGYLPLALRICAAMLVDTPNRPVSALVESLRRGGNLIDRLSREDQGVRAVFDISYERLTEPQKRLLGFMSFTPTFDISTTAAACLINSSFDATEELLIEISRAHLIEQGAEWGRWRLHDLVRKYALDAVKEAVGQEEALLRVLTYYAECSHAASLAVGGDLSSEEFSSRDDAFSWFDAEYENLIFGVDVTGKQEGLLWFAAHIPHRLARYLDARRLYSEWRDMMTLALQMAQEGGYEELEANALNSLGMAYRELREIGQSVAFHEDAIAIARKVGDDEMLARYLNNAGNALREARDLDGALEAHSEAARLFSAQGDELGFARATDNAASILRDLGRPSEAISMHEEAIATFRQFGDRGGEATTLTHLGSTLNDLGQYDEAAALHRNSAQLLLVQGREDAAAMAFGNLSNALRAVGDFRGAVSASRESLRLCLLIEDRFGEARARNQLGLLCADGGLFSKAIHNFEEGIKALADFEDLILAGYLWANLGRTYGMMGKVAAAIESFSKAEGLFHRLKAPADALSVRQIIDVLSLRPPHGDSSEFE